MSNHKSHNVQGMGWSFKQALGMALAVSLMTGCATTAPPEYRPLVPGERVGYSDLQLSPNRYRVSFLGSTASTRDDVERYLLRRAAEVTLQTGHTHFVLTNRDTERDTYLVGDNYLRGPAYYYYPYRPWYGHDLYWGGDIWSEKTYSAFAEVVMFMANEASSNPQAIDALGLLQRLAPQLPVASAALPSGR